jgi:asparagine synthase (glutamine-hydrolysing)
MNEKIIYQPFTKYLKNNLDLMNQVFIADLNVKCAFDFMPLIRMNEVNGLETKIPWLFEGLIKFAFTIPPDLKYRNGDGKYILKNAFKGLIPKMTINKKTKGFGPNPLNVWKKGLKYWIQKFVVNGETVKQGYINGAYVEKILAKSS